MRALSPAFIAAGTLVAGVADFDLAAARTSVSVTRPSGPVPFTLERSTPSSAAIRRATGDAFTRASSVFSIFGAGFSGAALFSAFGGAAFFSSFSSVIGVSSFGCSAFFGFSSFFSSLAFGFSSFSSFSFFFFFFFGCFLIFTTDKGNPVAHVYLAALLYINLGQGSVLGGFPFHRRLVGLNLS